MEWRSKPEEQFNYFNIRCGIDSVYGNWAVSNEGDVVNYVYPYAIMKIHLYDRDWIKAMRAKVWFTETCVQDLEKAIERAKIIRKI